MPDTIKAHQWKDNPASITGSYNTVLMGDEFYISFMSDRSANTGIFASEEGTETALCSRGNFFILNGDWREQYEAVVDQGFDACKAIFDANQDKKSSWSS